MSNIKNYESLYKESSLSRIWKHNIEHDCGAITAFRKCTDCDCTNGRLYTKKEKLQRNKSLTAQLISLGYGVIRLNGKYPEGDKVTKEISYFVVDLKDSGYLEKDIIRLGKDFQQDSVLFIPKGAIENKSKAYLIGTNHCENNWLGFGKKEIFNKGKLGYESPIYTSYVNGRPFIFESVDKEIKPPGSGMGWWLMRRIAEKNWKDIEV